MNKTRTIRPEYPRPDFKREKWQSLNGTWDFAFGEGKSEASLIAGEGYDKEILVPFVYQCQGSGIGDISYHETVWYKKTLLMDDTALLGGSVLLHFGGIDYESAIYVNGQLALTHKGGYTQISCDIAPYLHAGENLLIVKATDDRQVDHPRGKQYWKDTPDRCWYTPMSGIWKPVWIEYTGKIYFENVSLLADIERKEVRLDAKLNRLFSGAFRYEICYQGNPVKEAEISLRDRQHIHEVITLVPEDYVDEVHYWSPEEPNLYEVKLYARPNAPGQEDQVTTYFGMREIVATETDIYLNHRPLYQRLILNQGYFKDSLLTNPSEEAIIHDLELIKAMGFNGFRMHQKIDEPLLYYHADRLGLLVWLELPSAYEFNATEITAITSEWSEIIRQNINHPSIISYVPFNESWGVRDICTSKEQQSFATGIYYLTKALDPTRLISTNDGWELLDATDFYGVHSYFADMEAYEEKWADWERAFTRGMTNRPLMSKHMEGVEHPVLMTEFGGIAFKKDLGSEGAWGYHESALSDSDYARRMKEQVEAILLTPYFNGYCYTQLTDVFQEVNGLLTMDREPKIPVEKIADIFGKDPVSFR